MVHTAVDHLDPEHRRWTIGAAAVLVVLCSIGLCLLASDWYSENQIRRLIRGAYEAQRAGGGRLAGTAYRPATGSPHRGSDLGRAQVFLLRHPEMKERQLLQGMIYLANSDWHAFTDGRFPSEMPRTAATLNNLGVSFLALSEKNPTYLLKALEQFEQAIDLDPRSIEPRFNLVITYQKLRLRRSAEEALRRYSELDSSSAWYRELTHNIGAADSDILNRLRQITLTRDVGEAERLIEENPELSRRLAMEHGLSDTQESPALVRLISNRFKARFGDETISAMLAPLFTEHRQTVLEIRKFVAHGAELYFEGDLNGSLEAYSRADKLLAHTASVFDRLWIDINRVDTWIRAGDFDRARDSLDGVILTAKEHKFNWLQAKALSIYGSTLRLTNGYGQMLQLLGEADRLFIDIGASNDRVRPLYYLAVYHYGVGDHDEALRLSLECLRLTDEADGVRMSSLDFLIGSILYRQGLPEWALLFERESLEQTQKARNAGLETAAASILAQLYQSTNRPALAQHYLNVASDASRKVPSGYEQIKAEVTVNMVKARICLDEKRYEEAEALLNRNITVYSQLPFQVTNVLSQSLMLLARVFSETNRIDQATQTFNKAIAVVENDDYFLATEKLRVKFDDERRDLYDNAIAFEYGRGSTDSAWTYVQRYRAKLFLEFLAQFDPSIERVRGEALVRSKVQKLVPADTQIIEYVLLQDRLLIWVISDKQFVSRSISVSRSEFEDKVQEALRQLRHDQNADPVLEELGTLLIEPINDLLDPKRTIAVIPDRALHGLPFAALRRPGSSKYLIQDFSILVSPSLTNLLATTATRPERGSVVGFGSQFDDSSEMKELRALGNIYRSSTMLAGTDVDRPRFLAAMSTAPVIHYAGHSATDAVDPLRSSILLDGNRYGPNSVTAVDISQQRLWQNAVVVLSSCDSSVGNSRDGVGMRGLTSAFLIGGAGSVVGSLWPVEASSTSDLMISFHRAFGTDKMPVAKALRQAQLAFLESFPERAHPYYWSGFVVTGNFSALR
jgi:CHAT domain-containing protein